MKYTLKNKRNIRQTRKLGGGAPQTTMSNFFGKIKEQKQELQRKKLQSLPASRKLIKKHITFNNNTKPENNSKPYRYGKIKNDFSNFGLSPEMVQKIRNRKSNYNSQIAEIYANIQSRANNAEGMEQILYSNKKYGKVPKVVKTEIQEKIWRNFGNNYN
jgi:hypothetical protein